jgi:hypothetical protein
VCIIGPNENRRDLGHVPQLFRHARAEQEFFVDAKMPNEDGAGPLDGAY